MGKSKLYCSFCGKSQDEVLCLIAGPTVFICDECVELCKDIVFQHRVVKAVQRLMPEMELEPPPPHRPLSDFIAAVRAEIAASGTEARKRQDREDGPDPKGDGPTLEEGDAPPPPGGLNA